MGFDNFIVFFDIKVLYSSHSQSFLNNDYWVRFCLKYKTAELLDLIWKTVFDAFSSSAFINEMDILKVNKYEIKLSV